jgi:acetyltransferase-like isoleucine patch superfamily enzyme
MTSISPLATIYPLAKITNYSNLSVAEYSQIDDFVFLNPGLGLTIGRYVHISSFVSVIGGGTCILEDFSGLSAGCRIVTASDDFHGGYLTNPTIPPEFRNVKYSSVRIGRHAILGTNVTVMPGITIGEGATIAAGAIVNKDLEPWSVYAGFTPRKVAERDRDKILAAERNFLNSLPR